MLASIHRDDLLRLAQIVREETGNQVQEKNYSMLESRIRARLLKLGQKTMAEYWTHFHENERAEREVIQSLMTTHYTFFFREYAHFEVLEKWLEQNIEHIKNRYNQQKQPLLVWSAACSRGQEVYSLAMFLEFNLYKKHNIPFLVYGTDLDPESVSYGKNGVYPIKEVNSIPQNYLNALWKKGTGSIKDFAAIHPDLRNKVKFETLNLLDVNKWDNKEIFDVIFCRNVFIYFSDENVQKIALALAKKLNPRGLFVSGVSEPLRFSAWKMESIGPSCYSFEKQEFQTKVSASKPSSTTTEVASAPMTASVATRDKYSVLCVDDSPTIQLLIKKIFAQDPFCQKVEVANNGREAREKLDAGKYNLITLDIHMPEVTGIEFLEKKYNKKKDPPVLMISSVNRSDLELATKSLSLGAFDYVEKPSMNNLQKSTEEILTKAKMALRSKENTLSNAGAFDNSIAQKIVVPDASICLRLVLSGPQGSKHLEHIVRGQKNELRSPPLVIVDSEKENLSRIESEILGWTELPVVRVHDTKAHFKPNTIYLLLADMANEVLSHSRHQNLSLQIVDPKLPLLECIKKSKSIQALLDESLSQLSAKVTSAFGVPISDITPSTSFPSLSVEYFANIRKAAA